MGFALEIIIRWPKKKIMMKQISENIFALNWIIWLKNGTVTLKDWISNELQYLLT